MSDMPFQSGQVSGFGHATQPAQSTYTAPTDIVQATTFEVNVVPNVVIYETLNGTLDAENQTRIGVPEITAKLTAWLFSTQAQALWKALIGHDTMSGVSNTSFGTLTALVSPTCTVTTAGTAGTTSYTYEVVAVNANGDSIPGATQNIATGNATLNATNYNVINWAAVNGASSYKIVRTASSGTPATTGLIATVTGVTTFNDQGSVATAYTPSASNVCATAKGASLIYLSGAVPATAAGIGSWLGGSLILGTAGSASYEIVPIVAVSGSTATTYSQGLANVHPSTDTAAVNVSHCLQVNIGSAKTTFDWLSLVGQWATMFERQVLDARVSSGMIKGDDEKLSQDFTFVADSPLNAEIWSNVGTLTTLTPGSGEANDSPFTQRDGGLITKFAAADTVPTLHTALTALSYGLNYNVKAQKVGGRPLGAVPHIFGKRTQQLTFSELAGQDGLNHNRIKPDFVDTQNETAVFLWFWNRKTNTTIGLYLPRCTFLKYDPVGPTDNPVAYNGEIKPLNDFTGTGIPLRLWLCNGTTTQL